MTRLRFAITSSHHEVDDLVGRAGDQCARQSGGPLGDSLRLCLAEALNNVVSHAYGGVAGLPIRLWLVLRGSGYDAVVADGGRPMPGGAPPAGQVAFDPHRIETLPEGGFGWPVIRAEADRLSYRRRRGVNVLTLGKTIRD